MKSEIGGAYSTHGEMYTSKDVKGQDRLKNLGVNWKIILKLILKK
jgi:hypothetical protein